MDPFTSHRGIAAPLLRENIDTDAIIPSREMKRVSKRGLSEGLFANWRYTEGRVTNPDFILNQPGFDKATILLSLSNFGCGSSREHAVWAIAEYGIRVIIAESFGAIFQKNCTSNGILTGILDQQHIHAIADWVSSDPEIHQVQVDLEARQLTFDENTVSFDVSDNDRRKLLSGLDPIEETLTAIDQIRAFETRHQAENPWVTLGKQ